MEKKKKTTIYDIAKEVGTSAATVSRVLSNSGYPVKDELRNKILEAAKELNYSPNIIGRMLKKNESRDIGVIVPNISNPFFPQLVLGIEQEARKRGYNILLCNSFRDFETERKYIQSLCQKQIGGIILSSVNEDYVFLEEIQQSGVKLVVLDNDSGDLKCNKIGFDYVKGGMMAIDYLVEMGHRDIAFISSPFTKKSRSKAFEGYKLGLYRNNIAFTDEYLMISDIEKEFENTTYEFENGKCMVDRLLRLEKCPTAVFAVNDMTAFGIVQRIINLGLKVPEDISVVGFDNLELSSMINPPLTTINQPSIETGRLASRILIDSMNETRREDISISLEPSLVIRNSVRNLRI